MKLQNQEDFKHLAKPRKNWLHSLTLLQQSKMHCFPQTVGGHTQHGGQLLEQFRKSKRETTTIQQILFEGCHKMVHFGSFVTTSVPVTKLLNTVKIP